MKIVVLAGGISTERDVSLSSGTGIYKALKKNGHQVILVDVFLGYQEDMSEDVFALDKDWAVDMKGVSAERTDISQILAMRPDYKKSFFGPNVITLCQQADVVFMALHGAEGENGKIQACFDLMGIRYTGTTHISSMRFFSDESIHAVSGFFALLLSITALDITKSWKGRKFILSDYARVAAVYYLTTIADEVVSPASDYVIMCMIFFIVIKWLDCLADEEDSAVITPYALLCVACVYAITLKLTAGVILILLLKPAYELLRQKKWRDIFLYLGMGLIVAVPWFARTVMISGWLLYPFPALDLFDVDWKMSAELIKVDAAQISTWGKALYNSAMADAPVNVWFPNWFSTTLSGTEKILILGDFVCILVYVLGLIWTFFKKKWGNLDKLLVLGAVICSYLFWQFSAPLIRYGYAYVLLVAFLVIGWLIISIEKNKIVYYAVILYGIYKAVVLGDYITNSYLVECYIYQQDYGEYEMMPYQIGEFTFYTPAEGDLQGDDYFPATPTMSEAVPRGDRIEDGFRFQ